MAREQCIDPRDTVRSGYDTIADEYLARVSGSRSGDGVRTQVEALVAELTSRLPEGGDALDLGCGAGVPFTQLLSRHFRVTGVDFSSRQLELARQNVSGAKFLHADMTKLELPSDSFDVVTAFFSMIHVPRDGHEQLMLNIASWLRPGGLFLASFGKRGAAEYWEEDWLGAPMFWSYHDPGHAQELAENAGLKVDRAWVETIEEGIDGPETFFWLLASK